MMIVLVVLIQTAYLMEWMSMIKSRNVALAQDQDITGSGMKPIELNDRNIASSIIATISKKAVRKESNTTKTIRRKCSTKVGRTTTNAS